MREWSDGKNEKGEHLQERRTWQNIVLEERCTHTNNEKVNENEEWMKYLLRQRCLGKSRGPESMLIYK